MTPVCTIAQNLAKNCGYLVFPCGHNKRPTIPGEGGYKHGSTDAEVIARLWKLHPGDLIGVVTGAGSGIDVLDIDAGRSHDNADAARAWWHANSARIPSSRAYQSGSGGIHIYFRHAQGVINTASRIAPGIDTRGEGGYVVFWYGAGRECFDHHPPAEWPGWLLQALAPKPAAVSSARPRTPSNVEDVIRRALRQVGNAPDGGKHEAVRKAARLLGGVQDGAGFSDSDAVGWIADVLPPTVKDWRNVERTAVWGLDRGRQEPINTRGAA
jgi:hypothetical protein